MFNKCSYPAGESWGGGTSSGGVGGGLLGTVAGGGNFLRARLAFSFARKKFSTPRLSVSVGTIVGTGARDPTREPTFRDLS